jgi:hypothetical protein
MVNIEEVSGFEISAQVIVLMGTPAVAPKRESVLSFDPITGCIESIHDQAFLLVALEAAALTEIVQTSRLNTVISMVLIVRAVL